MKIRLVLLAFALCLPLGLAPIAAEDFKLPDVAQPGKGGYVTGELVYPLDDKPTPQCHASTIAETPSGLVAAWFGGKHEKNTDVAIWVSRLSDDGWSKQ